MIVAAIMRGTYCLVSLRINFVLAISEKDSAWAFRKARITFPSPALYAAIARGQFPNKS